MSGFTNSFRMELFLAIHDFTADAFRLALFGPGVIDLATAAYDPTGEVAGPGYAPGGLPVSFSPPAWLLGGVVLQPADVIWPLVTISVTHGLIYNASKANRSVAFLEFGGPKRPVNGSFTVKFDVPLRA